MKFPIPGYKMLFGNFKPFSDVILSMKNNQNIYLKEWLKIRGVSNSELERHGFATRKTVRGIVNGGGWNTRTLYHISSYLGIPMEYLFREPEILNRPNELSDLFFSPHPRLSYKNRVLTHKEIKNIREMAIAPIIQERLARKVVLKGMPKSSRGQKIK
jgi:hypothetical protein